MREILESCDKKEFLYKKWKMYPNNEIIRTEYKNYLKVHDKIIKDAKCKYDREQIISNIGDSRRLWRVVNNRLGRNLKEDGYINSSMTKISTKFLNQIKYVIY